MRCLKCVKLKSVFSCLGVIGVFAYQDASCRQWGSTFIFQGSMSTLRSLLNLCFFIRRSMLDVRCWTFIFFHYWPSEHSKKFIELFTQNSIVKCLIPSCIVHRSSNHPPIPVPSTQYPVPNQQALPFRLKKNFRPFFTLSEKILGEK